MRQGFQKGRKAAKLPAIPHELTSYLIEKLPHTTNMRNICHKTQALDRPRFIQEKKRIFPTF